MAKVDPNAQDAQARGGFTETPEEKVAWRNMRKLIKAERVMEQDTFRVKGHVAKILLAEGNKYFSEDRKDPKSGEIKKWYFVKVVPVITDPRVVGDGKPLKLMEKKVGISFFNGVNRDGTRSTFLGGMYSLHKAATHAEPSQGLIDQKEAWDTDDYCDKPLLLEMIYLGLEEEGSKYHGTKANLKCFLQGFARDPDFAPGMPDLEDDEDDDDPPFNQGGDDAARAAELVAAGAGKRVARPVDEDDDDF